MDGLLHRHEARHGSIRMTNFLRPRLVPMIACAVSVALCLLYAYFRSELPHWWRNYGGGVPYVLFWILFAFTVIPHRRYIVPVVVGVVLLTCGLEVLQLWNPEPLAQFRSTKFGAALLGSSFVWMDFPPYFIGGVVGWAVLRLIARQSPNEVDS